MIRALILLWLLVVSGGVAAAAPVQVTSGDHGNFTRLVLDYGAPVDWQMGRTTDGYELRLNDANLTYDLSAIYQLISHDRLSAIWTDPETGALHLGVGCTCYAMPFAFRPGIVVIDLYDGTPPKGSSFELALDGEAVGKLQEKPVKRPRQRPNSAGSYDWVSLALGRPMSVIPAPPTAPRPATPRTMGGDPALVSLRAALFEELSRGAAVGVIEMALPKTPDVQVQAETPSVNIHLGETPNIAAHLENDQREPMTALGAACFPDESLAFSTWADDRSIAEQFAEAMTGLSGEFDRPDPAAVNRAVHFSLYLGFGAETRNLLASFPVEDPAREMWQSLAHILDDEPDPQPAFAGMAACDTFAAFWALLSEPASETAAPFNAGGALRAFSALPPHLRRYLGPRLVAAFTARGDGISAASARDAVLRAPGEASPEVALLQAAMDTAAGDRSAVEARLEPLVAESGPANAEALVTLVETLVAGQKPVRAEQVMALASMLKERRGSEEEPRFRRALILAEAAAGDFDQAFAALPDQPDVGAALWSLLAALAPDSALLDHAVLADAQHPPDVAAVVAGQIAERLNGLGFSDQAQRWLDLVAQPDPILQVRIDLGRNDARAALRHLGGLQDDPAASLRAEALIVLGDDQAAAEVYKAAGADDAYWSAESRARNWAALAEGGPKIWQNAAAALHVGKAAEAAPLADPLAVGPLALGQALVDSSAETRAALEALLTAVKAPEVATQ